MGILLLDALVPDTNAWLAKPHSVEFRPELADRLLVLRTMAYKTRIIVFPRQTVMRPHFLDFLPKLNALAQLNVGSDNNRS